MAQAIVYCDKCARMIPRGEIASGEAVATGGFAVCAACLAELPPEQRATLTRRRREEAAEAAPSGQRRGPAPKKPRRPTAAMRAAAQGIDRRKRVRGTTGTMKAAAAAKTKKARGPTGAMKAAGEAKAGKRQSGRREAVVEQPLSDGQAGPVADTEAPPTKGFPVAVAVILGAGALVGLVAGALLLGGSSEEGPSGEGGEALPPLPPVLGPATPAEDPPTAPEPPSPRQGDPAAASRRLAEIREEIDRDPMLLEYKATAKALKAFPDRFGGTPAAAEAGKLLAEVEARYGETAEARLQAARRTAEEHVANDRFAEAISLLRYTGSRLAGSEWYETRGKGEIASTIEEIKRKRAERERSMAAAAKSVGAGYVVGLRGEYFSGKDMNSANLAHDRVDPKINFRWSGSPAPGVGGDEFSVRWTGELKVPEDGTYNFDVQHDDIGRLWVDGKRLTGQEGQSTRGSVELKAGWLPFRFEFVEHTGTAIAKVKWSGPGLGMTIVGEEHLRTPAEKGAPALVTKGPATYLSGLLGEYHDGTDLAAAKLLLRRIDPGIDFDWGEGSPLRGADKDGFSCRWTGELKVPADGRYEFLLKRDDGVRFWVGGEQLVDAWGMSNEDCAAGAELEAGWVPVRVEYFEGGGKARVSLRWSGPGFEAAVIPRENLRTAVEMPAAETAADTREGLVSYWKFDETEGTDAADSSGKGKGGSLKNTTGTEWTVGRIGGALSFDGVDGYVEMGGADVAPPWTVAVWVIRQDAPGNSAILNSPTYSVRLENWDSVGFTHYKVRDYEFGYSAPVDEWIHLAFVGSATDTALYVNGAYHGAVPASISAPMWSMSRDGKDRLNGILDDLRVYGRALAAGEIAALAGVPEEDEALGLPGVWGEVEKGRGHTSTRDSPKASGGKQLRWFDDPNRKVAVTLHVPKEMPDAYVYLRYSRERKGGAELEVWLTPPDAAAAKLGRMNAVYTGGPERYRWATISAGDLAAGTHAVRIVCPEGSTGADLDVLGLVGGEYRGRWRPPNRARDGKLLDAGYIAALARSERERKELLVEASARPRTEGYFLSLAALVGLRELSGGLDEKEKVKAKKLAAVCGPVAASTSFDSGLKKKLRFSEGYRFARKVKLPDESMSTPGAHDAFERHLRREKPEVVRICFDVSNLPAADKDAKKNEQKIKGLGEQLARYVRQATAHGAIPVLFTAPGLANPNDPKQKIIGKYNKMVLDLAAEMNVPCVDAWGILNGDRTLLAAYFGAAGRLKPKGFDAVSARFLRLYFVLERWVLGRERPFTGQMEGVAEAGPVRSHVAAAPGGNLVAGGGFEEMTERPRFAKHWKSHRWGDGSARSSVRTGGANPHTGERSLVVRAFGPGAKPGAFTTLTLPAGRYEVSFWACAAVDETARIGGSLAGADLNTRTAAGDWQRFTETVEVPERKVGAALRLWLVSEGRVWFDDVEVKAVK